MDYALLGINPVNKEKPAGENVRDELIYDEFQQELDKLNSPALRSEFHWRDILGPAAIILKSYSKDLLVSSYLGIALTHVHKIEGLIWSVGLLKNMVATFWDDLWPAKKRFKGRISAIQFWIDQTNTILETDLIENIKSCDSKKIQEEITQLETLLFSKKEDLKTEEPDQLFQFARIISSIKDQTERVEVIPEKKNNPVDNNYSAGPAKTSSNNVSSENFALVETHFAEESFNLDSLGSGETKKLLSKKFQDIKHLARKMRQEKPEDPRPYKWARMCIWDLLEMLPPASSNKTRIKSPPGHALELLESLYQAGNWKELLELSEIKITNSQYLFCIDISRYSAQALANLGDSYARASTAICNEVKNLISRLPGLIDYEFADGTPFVSSASNLWIDGITNTSSISIDSKPDTLDANPKIDDGLNALVTGAVTKEKMQDNIIEIQKLINGSDSKKGTFLSRMGLINVLMNNNKINPALPHMDKALSEIENYKLEFWEPKLALSVFCLAVKIFNLAKRKGYKEQTENLINKIALIDMQTALKFM
ncbi:MAG: type VI secretion system protein TssA [Desulfobacteraceae bacterium]|nr:type VI secretion system protein TssA [Desulfobacteraceae bacterium]